jgi:hypothetical protein
MPPCGATTRGRVKFRFPERGKSKAAVAFASATIITVSAIATVPAITTVSALATLAARAPAATATPVVASATTAAAVTAATTTAAVATASTTVATAAGRTTTAATTAAAAGSAPVFCLANPEITASEIGSVELCDRRLTHLTTGEGHKGEAALTTSLPVKWHV